MNARAEAPNKGTLYEPRPRYSQADIERIRIPSVIPRPRFHVLANGSRGFLSHGGPSRFNTSLSSFHSLHKYEEKSEQNARILKRKILKDRVNLLLATVITYVRISLGILNHEF